jgi:hypothetical protein
MGKENSDGHTSIHPLEKTENSITIVLQKETDGQWTKG